MNECHFENIEFHIKKALFEAKSRILIAVAWFTNQDIANVLIQKTGLTIEIVVDDNPTNRNAKTIIACKNAGVEVNFIKDLSNKYYLMHNKFCVIDNLTVLTGSYNWTKNANTNNENIAVIKDKEIAALFIQEFRSINESNKPREIYFYRVEETEEIRDLLYKELFALLKRNFNQGNLQKGDLMSYSSEAIKNKIRVLEESVRNKFVRNPPILSIYADLLEKYGVYFYRYASSDEFINSVSKYKKHLVKNADLDVDFVFQQLKTDVIRIIQRKYMKRISVKQDEEIEHKLFVMCIYLMEEIKSINQGLHITRVV